MKQPVLIARVALILLLLTLPVSTRAQDAFDSVRRQDPFNRLSVIPRGLGINIYSGGDNGINTPDTASQIDSVGANSDFGWIRVDFHWKGVPRTLDAQGHPVYSFDYYDELMNKLKANRLRPIFILDDMDPAYDHDQNDKPNCYQDNGRLNCSEQIEFARFASQAVNHLKGQGIIWEIYNEPDLVDLWKIHFGQPKATAGAMDYVRLALRVGKTLREVAPDEIYVGPAISNIEGEGLAFLELCLQNRLLDYWTAISVHPYRKDENPETVFDDFKLLRRLIAKYDRNKSTSIINSEWGYSSYWPETNMNEIKQAKYLARTWLCNLASDIKISIWYKWLGFDQPMITQHFRRPYFQEDAIDEEKKRDSGYGIRYIYDTPKSAWYAATTLTNVLGGYHADLTAKPLLEELSENPGPRRRQTNFAVLFIKGSDYKVAAWTTSTKPRQVLIRLEPGKYSVTGMLGATGGQLRADKNGLRITLNDSPIYLAPVK